jgi:hypothetical protein
MSERFKSRKSWREKLENPPPGLQKTMGGENILVPTPLLVDELIRKVTKKKLTTVGQIRKKLAQEYRAYSTCPLTVGIFLRIISEAAEEDRQSGKNLSRAQSREQVTPYWRVVKDDGSLNPKYPGGVEAQAAHLEAEGHRIIPGRGKKPPKVADFEKALV